MSTKPSLSVGLGVSALCPCGTQVFPWIVTALCLVCLSYPCLNPTLTLSGYSVPLSKLLNIIKIMNDYYLPELSCAFQEVNVKGTYILK